jgi:hypothetical protein
MQDQTSILNFEQRVLLELESLKGLFSKTGASNISPDWIPRKEVMRFLSYGDTQMAALEKTGELIITKVGKRKFIHRDSLNKLLEKNIQQP